MSSLANRHRLFNNPQGILAPALSVLGEAVMSGITPQKRRLGSGQGSLAFSSSKKKRIMAEDAVLALASDAEDRKNDAARSMVAMAHFPRENAPGSAVPVPTWSGLDYCASDRGMVLKQMSRFGAMGFPLIHTAGVNPILGTEATTSADVANTLGLVGLNSVFQGAASYNRVGRTIQMKKLSLHGVIAPFGFGSSPDQQTNEGGKRLLIVYDRQPNGFQDGIFGSFPKYSDIMLDVNYAGYFNWNAFSCQNPLNADRFEILYDRLVAGMGLPTGDPSQSNGYISTAMCVIGAERVVDIHLDLGDRCVKYSDGNASIIQSGALYLVCAGNDTTTPANSGNPYSTDAFSFSATLQYVD